MRNSTQHPSRIQPSKAQADVLAYAAKVKRSSSRLGLWEPQIFELLALGVSEDDVFADYEFTNQAVDIEARLPRIQERMEERLARKLDAASLWPMLGVNVDYLREAFAALHERQGSADAYLADVLGVDANARQRLRHKLIG